MNNIYQKGFKRWLKLTLLAITLLSWSAIVANIKNDFHIKGFHIDLRCQVMTIPALKAFATELAGFGINTIIMEYEATFPFEENATLSNKYAYSKEELRSFINHCQGLGIDVIPLQNCFGHSEYILAHDRYSHVKEDRKEVSQVCPSKEDECIEIFSKVFREVAEMHPSKYFHIGGDETYLLGSCKECAQKSAKEGKSKLFVDYVKAMCKIVHDLGKQPILWADVILKYPEAVNELPKDAIFIDWNYGWKNDYFGDINRLYKEGVTFWGSPSIRSHPDNQYLTQWNKHFANQQQFIPYCREKSYQGIVMTSWSNGGTYGFLYDTNWEVIQMFPIRYVYPLSGFRIIVACYGEALKTEGAVDAKGFVIKYGAERFGLTPAEGEELWNILTSPQEMIIKGKDVNGKSVSEVLKETKSIRSRLYKLSPSKNSTEFEHFKLMFDIRVHYLSFKEIESEYESDQFSRSRAPEFQSRLKPLILEAKRLDSRFFKLNRGFLHDRELKEINQLRNEKLLKIYETMNTLTR